MSINAPIIVGIMWCKNEGDLLPYTIPMALKQVDCLMIADDDSTDNSWEVIKSFDKKLIYKVRRQDKINDTIYSSRVFSRQHLLDEVRRRFKEDNVWIQVIESDVAILDTDIRTIIKKYAVEDISVRWHMLNACRREWTPEFDLPRIPKGIVLNEYFDAAHWMEQISSYTFRPLPELAYTERPVPWPQGFSKYLKKSPRLKLHKWPDSPLLIHYGFRSPMFYYEKMKKRNYGRNLFHKYPSWDLSSPAAVKRTVPFYNGVWNNNVLDTFEPISREGWIKWLKKRKNYLGSNS